MSTRTATPGVYVDEIALLPPSVAEAETAIPAFIGYTGKAVRDGVDLTATPTRIGSLLQYRELFGGDAPPKKATVTLRGDNSVERVEIEPRFFLYKSLQLFFANGGGDCYIVSAGEYTDTVSFEALEKALKAVREFDEPTLLLFPDAVLLADETEFAQLQMAALTQCGDLQDRFAILDTLKGDKEDVIPKLRDGVGMANLKYGAAYYPWVEATLKYRVRYANLEFQQGTKVAFTDLRPDATASTLDAQIADMKTLDAFIDTDAPGGVAWRDAYSAIAAATDAAKGKAELNARIKLMDALMTAFRSLAFKDEDLKAAFEGQKGERLNAHAKRLQAFIVSYKSGTDKLDALTGSYGDLAGVAVDSTLYESAGDAKEKAETARPKLTLVFDRIVQEVEVLRGKFQDTIDATEKTLEETNPLYQSIQSEIGKFYAAVPPSGAIAGVYARVDRTRGVWKSPANESLALVRGPSVRLTEDDQASLNVDAVSGKSVNAIRFMTGKGTMVWGARTLAGNDNEWRYVSVRRFFNTVEEALKKSTSWAVFEPNDPNTWVKVKSMIENYLTIKWRDGALVGARADDAFFVKVGVPATMTETDVLEGRMNVEIGLRVARPAEFIILKFTHKVQAA